jgi:hypothetical protein
MRAASRPGETTKGLLRRVIYCVSMLQKVCNGSVREEAGGLRCADLASEKGTGATFSQVPTSSFFETYELVTTIPPAT